jgi:hypothetical protein
MKLVNEKHINYNTIERVFKPNFIERLFGKKQQIKTEVVEFPYKDYSRISPIISIDTKIIYDASVANDIGLNVNLIPSGVYTVYRNISGGYVELEGISGEVFSKNLFVECPIQYPHKGVKPFYENIDKFCEHIKSLEP